MALEARQSPTGFEEPIKDPILDSEKDAESGRKYRFGGSNKPPGARIGPVLPHLRGADYGTSDSETDILASQLEAEEGNSIQYRTCSWPKTAALLFSEYICLAIMSFPYSYAVLGLVPGLILTVVVAGLVLYTSLVVWEFCLRHPEVRDVCDVGQMLFWGKTWAWYATAVMFVLNNTFIQGLHILVSTKYLNTITNHSQCTIVFAVIATIICWLCSLPRTFSALAKLGTASAFFTFVSVLLATIFIAIEARPAGYNPDPNYFDATTGIHGGEPLVTAIPVKGTTFVAGMSAFLNISYTFIGQITIPSFIAEMRDPKDFPKALWVVTIGEIIVFSIVGAVIYAYVGDQYYTAPAFGSLSNEVYKKVSFSFMIPTLIFLGVLYASVSARFIFFRIFEGTRHKSNHTVVGWAAWAGILALTWIGAFIIAEVIPFFSDLLSLMSSLFDSFFGFIFWGVAYIRMRRVDGGVTWLKEQSVYGYAMLALNIFIIIIGLFFLSAGTYTSVQSIIDSYAAGAVGGVFTCADNGL
ncbi:N amino acid transport system protein [Lachnellula suecica]|uniref:N amino acid transport system protein n=1 Tax=Lachnellula suecica TaxID=602035 RepID=A0A8T9CDR3_9HELO|nr:N amino acid transport system protein [Lachnellula suecica]